MMKRTLEVEKEYYKTYHGQKAIDKFFKTYPELEEWKEAFEWMLQENKDFYSDDTFADGTRNNNWTYALHFDDSDDFTYICIIEREEVKEAC